MRILILGGSGFIGRALAGRLIQLQHEVVTVSRNGDTNFQIDLTLPLAIESLISATHFDAVVNLAGAGLTSGSADTATMEQINTDLPTQVFEALNKSDQKSRTHLIHASSSTERLPAQKLDESLYSKTKFLGTSRLRDAFFEIKSRGLSSPTDLTICRIHNTYGPGQPHGRFISHVTRQLMTETPVRLMYPNRVRDFVFLDDTVSGLICLIDAGQSAPIDAELGTGVGISLHQAALVIADLLKKPRELIVEPLDSTEDPNPVTVATHKYGSLGNCRTSFELGLMQTLKEQKCAG